MTRSAGEYHLFARMSVMLDLSRDEKVACLSRLNVLKQDGAFVMGIVP